jgi:hypothetical protein
VRGRNTTGQSQRKLSSCLRPLAQGLSLSLQTVY